MKRPMMKSMHMNTGKERNICIIFLHKLQYLISNMFEQG